MERSLDIISCCNFSIKSITYLHTMVLHIHTQWYYILTHNGITYSHTMVSHIHTQRYHIFTHNGITYSHTMVPHIHTQWYHIFAQCYHIFTHNGITHSHTMVLHIHAQWYYDGISDVWLTACMGFLFAGLVEFAVVNSLARTEVMTRAQQRLSNGFDDLTDPRSYTITQVRKIETYIYAFQFHLMRFKIHYCLH